MNEIRLNNWLQFALIADSLDVGQGFATAYAFRGQSDAQWELQPALLRELRPHVLSPEKALELEASVASEFRSQAHLFLPSGELASTKDTVSWWTVMQHHGAPTRLLDWTTSIYVAAYFAVNENPDSDGAIWVVHMHSLHTAMKKEYGDIGLPDKEAEIRARFLDPNALPAVQFFTRLSKSARLVAQQGIFSIAFNILTNHGEKFETIFAVDGEKELYRKLVVPAIQKRAFAKKLRTMNITASSLFPGLDGLGRSIGELVRLGVES